MNFDPCTKRPARASLALITLLSTLTLVACSDSGDDSDSGAVAVPDAGSGTSDLSGPAGPAEPGPAPPPDAGPEPTNDPSIPVGDTPAFPALPSDLNDVEAVYRQDGYGEDDVVRIDVRTVTVPGPCTEEDESGCTLDDIIADTNSNDRFKPDVDVHFSAGDYPDDGTSANAQLRQRGGFTRFAPQKSFRIRLDDKDAPWRTERKILLNKHPYDPSRIHNALAMELLATVPHLLAFRTQFTELWIDDGAGAVDYGMFTQIEEPDDRWLERRGFEADGRLYKPELFRFSEQERDAIRVDGTGAPLDEKAFENYLEIEAGDDHRALSTVMDALHDPARSFESVLEQHFNRNNLQAWLAMNILLNQSEAVTHNYLLYNPAGTERFYFVPWDYDTTFAVEREPSPDAVDPGALRTRLRYGYARNVDNEVIRRFLQMPGAHERMVAAADELRTAYLDESSVVARADAMAAVVEPWLQRLPDSEHIGNRTPSPGTDFLASIEGNADALRTRFAVAMPPTLHEPRIGPQGWTFAWTPAFEVTGSALSYDLQVSRTPRFAAADLIVNLTGIADAPDPIEQTVTAPQAGAGTWYVRVIARSALDPARFWQVSNDVVEEADRTWPGMRRFQVR